LADREELNRRKELILGSERAFANQVGAAVFEKPKVSYWMVLIPILFLYFIYRMQKYKHGRMRFNDEFMITRGRVMDAAVDALEGGTAPDIGAVVAQSTLADGPAKQKYESWIRVLAEYYMDLLGSEGGSFEALVRSAYRGRTDCLLALNRLSTVEKEFYSALMPQMAEMNGASDIIGVIVERSQQLRRETAERVFA